MKYKQKLLKWLFTTLKPNTIQAGKLYNEAVAMIASGLFTTRIQVINYLYFKDDKEC
jgi:hypothetical protein